MTFALFKTDFIQQIFWSGLIMFGLNQNGLFSTEFFFLTHIQKVLIQFKTFFINYPKEGQGFQLKKQIVLIFITVKRFEF